MKFEGLKPSTRKDKRLMLIFSNPSLIIHFGLRDGLTYIDHKDKLKRDNYIKRHSVNEDWSMINPGSASRFILWGESTDLNTNLMKYLRRFGVSK